MKFQPKKLLALLLAGLMSLSAVSCATADDPEDTKDPYATEDTVEEETGYMPEAATTQRMQAHRGRLLALQGIAEPLGLLRTQLFTDSLDKTRWQLHR